MLNQVAYIKKMLICWKTINKFIVKNITSAESRIRISCILYEHPLDF